MIRSSRWSSLLLASQSRVLRPVYFVWWPVAELVWRLATTLVLRLLSDQLSLQVVLFALLLLARLTCVFVLRPYEADYNNREDEALALQSLVVLALGLVFYVGGGSDRMGVGASRAVLVCVVVTLVSMVCVVAYYVREAYRRRPAGPKSEDAGSGVSVGVGDLGEVSGEAGEALTWQEESELDAYGYSIEERESESGECVSLEGEERAVSMVLGLSLSSSSSSSLSASASAALQEPLLEAS
jgi:hypothetical protein